MRVTVAFRVKRDLGGLQPGQRLGFRLLNSLASFCGTACNAGREIKDRSYSPEILPRSHQ